MRSRQVQFVALLGQPRQFEMRAEVVRIGFERARPAGDSLPQRTIDVLEGLFGGSARRVVTRLAHSVENAASLGALPGLVTQKSVFERGMVVAGRQSHGGGELIACRPGGAGFQVSIS